MSKPQALIEQVRSSVAVELERRHAPTLLADRKAAKAAKHKAKHHKYTKAAFFRYCYYDPAFKFFCEQVLDVDYLPLPEATRAASEVGVQNSSDYVCTPFKHILGDFAEALEFNTKALDYDDEDAVVLDNLGQLYLAMGDREKALTYFKKAHENKPRQVDTLYYLARLAAEDGDTKQAIDYLNSALDGNYSALCPTTRQQALDLKAELEKKG